MAALASDFNALSRRSGPDSRTEDADGSRRCAFSATLCRPTACGRRSTRRSARRRRRPDSRVVPSGRTWRPVIGFAEIDPTRRSRVPEKGNLPTAIDAIPHTTPSGVFFRSDDSAAAREKFPNALKSDASGAASAQRTPEIGAHPGGGSDVGGRNTVERVPGAAGKFCRKTLHIFAL